MKTLETPVFNAAYFIAKFEAIPEELWYDGGEFYKPGDATCRCAFGHCGKLSSDENPPEASGLWALESEMLEKVGSSPFLVSVNDGKTDRYLQPTPKQRVLAWLRDAQEAGL